MKDRFYSREKNKELVVGVVGLGYVGLPLVQLFIQADFTVCGFDIDQEKIRALQNGERYIEHIDPELLSWAYKHRSFLPTTDYSLVGGVDALILCVPTPLNRHREPDLKYVVQTVESVLPHLEKGQLICLESTTYPGTTQEVLVSRIQEAGFRVGEEIFVAYSPEREDPGNPVYKTKDIPKVVGGHTRDCLDLAVRLYSGVINQVVPVSSTKVSEMTKILENTFRAVNIALANELKLVADRMDIDIFEVIRTAATKPFGYMPFYPGPGLGGHCIPIDPFYLTWKAREYGLSTKFIELAGEVNTSMPEHVINKLIWALNSRAKPLMGARILVLGVAYKKNVDDRRGSPSLEIISKLRKEGANVDYCDPHVPVLTRMRHYDLDMRSVEADPLLFVGYDCVVISTDHDCFDWDAIYTHSDLILDPRGVFKEDKEKVFRA